MIENEIKFCLHSPDALEAKLRGVYDSHDIEQGYLDTIGSGRIRRIAEQNTFPRHVFTYKLRLHTGRNFEIETTIPADDFNMLWENATEQLRKRRYTVRVVSARATIRWDIDFPTWPSGARYFAIAEAEMPASMEQPEEILPMIEPFVVYAVPRLDSRFTARNLSSEATARRLAEEFGLL